MDKNKTKYFIFLMIISLTGIIFLWPKNTWAFNTIEPEVKIFTAGLQTSSFYGFMESFRGGVRVATGDINGDGRNEIIVGAGPGGGPNVQIFDRDGRKIKSFMAYDENFRGGIFISACDLDNDKSYEIITSPGSNGGPDVRVFEKNGNLKDSFMAYDLSFRGGVMTACGDVIGDDTPEIITSPGLSGGPQVRIFNNHGNSLNLDIWPYDTTFRGGVSLTVGNFLGNEKNEIVTGIYKQGSSHIKVFNNEFTQASEFFAYPEKFIGGVNLTAGDIDHDNFDEIITGANAGGGPHVRTFEYSGRPRSINFFPYPLDFRGGVFVASGEFNSDGYDEIITAPGYQIESDYPQYYKYIEIDISDQTLEYFENGISFGMNIISSGRPGMDTPQGTYKIINKSLNAYSNKYTLYMPWWMQFSSLGHGIHGLPYWKYKSGLIVKEGENHLGIRVSHGCVRLSWEAAEKLWSWAEIGTPIIIHQ